MSRVNDRNWFSLFMIADNDWIIYVRKKTIWNQIRGTFLVKMIITFVMIFYKILYLIWCGSLGIIVVLKGVELIKIVIQIIWTLGSNCKKYPLLTELLEGG